MGKPRDYCCCAIPLVNTGIYVAITEQFVFALVAGTLAIATPSIVGAATPSFASWIFAIVCYIGAGLQVLGYLGVKRENPGLFATYSKLNLSVLLAGFSVAIAWIILSATRHSTAQDRCLTDFFGGDTTNSEGTTLCNIFPWVGVGIMGGLWVIMAIMQIYLQVVISSYSASQRDDHRRYDATVPLTSGIPMDDRSDPWNTRPSADSLADGGQYGHNRNMSVASTATIMQDKPQQPYDTLSRSGTQYSNASASYPPNRGYAGSPPQLPPHAFTEEPGPTPHYNDGYHIGSGAYGDVSMDRPERSLAHPAEGSFRRKTPRVGGSQDFTLPNPHSGQWNGYQTATYSSQAPRGYYR